MMLNDNFIHCCEISSFLAFIITYTKFLATFQPILKFQKLWSHNTKVMTKHKKSLSQLPNFHQHLIFAGQARSMPCLRGSTWLRQL
jgi:hypothetical protein